MADGGKSNYRLTRFLYSVDEVKYSLITALLKKVDIDECYYWAFELYFSRIEGELFDLFYKIHYDFYAERNPKLEGFIKTKKEKWLVDKQVTHIASIVKNMFISDPTPTVFLMRQYIAAFGYPSHVYKNTNHIMHNTIINFSLEYKNLCSAISYGRLANIAYDINRLTRRDGGNVVHCVVIDYFETEYGGICEGGRKKINQLWKNRESDDDVHILLAIVVHLMADIKMIKTRQLFAIPLQTKINEVLLIENEIINPIYYTLSAKRKYKINRIIGSFELARDELPDFLNDNWMHWEYYATGVPLWNDRVTSLNGKIDHEKRELWFPGDDDVYDNVYDNVYDDDVREKFYKQYGYELDEQPKDVQYLSLYEIKSLCWKVWIYDVFGMENNNPDVKPNVKPDVAFDLILNKISNMNICETNIKEINLKGNTELDIDSIIKNIPDDYRFIYSRA